MTVGEADIFTNHSIHVYCPWAIRAWRYGGLPSVCDMTSWATTSGSLPWAEDMPSSRNMFVSGRIFKAGRSSDPSTNCLALHSTFRQGQSAKRIPVKTFLPYGTSLRRSPKGGKDYSIFTGYWLGQGYWWDHRTWPTDTVSGKWQQQVVRSNDTTPVFFTMASRNSTNTESLLTF
jgi:hypothetical protein